MNGSPRPALSVPSGYDVVVIGAGHAGCEAALAAARVGARVLLLAMSRASIAAMPCNPAIGGPGKGHLVREIDALGGAMGAAADAAARQVRLLNTSKGPAVQAIRAITDKGAYQAAVLGRLAEWAGQIEIEVAEALAIEAQPGGRYGVRLADNRLLICASVVLAAGVYLGAATTFGSEWREGGPGLEPAASRLAACLREMGFRLGRFKTGTSPRIDLRSVHLAGLPVEEGMADPPTFAHARRGVPSVARWVGAATAREPVCWRTETNPQTHALILGNAGRSPLLSGRIVGQGPRHCPSIESKVLRFADRARHPVYLERERSGSDSLYVLGLSTSLPADVQEAMVRSIKGLELARITAYGYAIEYDVVLPSQLAPTLESSAWPGVFFAGQVIGTSGYEEAAALGLVAGLNAARVALGEPPVVFERSESYIGVLTDDLTRAGVSEPYRIVTARAEHRLHLRHTNADLRLTEWGHGIGLTGRGDVAAVAARRARLTGMSELLSALPVTPSAESNAWLAARGAGLLRETTSAAALLARPEIGYLDLAELFPALPALGFDDIVEVAAQAKYGGYIRQQERWLERERRARQANKSRDQQGDESRRSVEQERACAEEVGQGDGLDQRPEK